MEVKLEAPDKATEEKRRAAMSKVIRRLTRRHAEFLRKHGKPLDSCVPDVDQLRSSVLLAGGHAPRRAE